MVRANKRQTVLLCCFVGVFALVSCSKFTSIEGTVSLDGQPIPQATLTFVPMESGNGGPREATARADMEGRFRVKTSNHQGVIPGKYKVLVSKRMPPKGLENPKDLAEAVKATNLSAETLPKRYTILQETPFEIDVAAGSSQTVELALTSK